MGVKVALGVPLLNGKWDPDARVFLPAPSLTMFLGRTWHHGRSP